MNVRIYPWYVPLGVGDKIRFYPRLFHTDRMVGGVFEGTNADPENGPYETIHVISSNPQLAWNEVTVDLKDYRYLRYRAPADSFGNVAEIEFTVTDRRSPESPSERLAHGTIRGIPFIEYSMKT